MLHLSPLKHTDPLRQPIFTVSSDGAASQLPNLFKKWEELLREKFGAGTNDEGHKQSTVKGLVEEAVIDNEAIRGDILLRLSQINISSNRREYVHIYQVLLTKLMNQIFLVIKTNPVNLETIKLLDEIYMVFQQTLDFVRDFFATYFDVEVNMPLRAAVVAKQELKQQLDFVQQAWVPLELASESLPRALLDYLERFCLSENTEITYREMTYHQSLLEEMRLVPVAVTAAPVRERLYFLNFNEPAFVEEEFERLRRLVRLAETPKQKIGVLKLEQKRINQLKTKIHCAHTSYLSSLKEQVNNWINEEVCFLESGYYNSSPEQDNGYAEKIHTSLSVAKLALIIRLLVVDKIIINRTVAPMLRIVAKLFTTLQKDEISFASMETKFHAPDKATIASVRDMLFKWIGILDKL